MANPKLESILSNLTDPSVDEATRNTTIQDTVKVFKHGELEELTRLEEYVGPIVRALPEKAQRAILDSASYSDRHRGTEKLPFWSRLIGRPGSKRAWVSTTDPAAARPSLQSLLSQLPTVLDTLEDRDAPGYESIRFALTRVLCGADVTELAAQQPTLVQLIKALPPHDRVVILNTALAAGEEKVRFWTDVYQQCL